MDSDSIQIAQDETTPTPPIESTNDKTASVNGINVSAKQLNIDDEDKQVNHFVYKGTSDCENMTQDKRNLIIDSKNFIEF